MSHHGKNGAYMRLREVQQNPLKTVNLAGRLKELLPENHPIERYVDIVAASSHAQVAGKVSSTKISQAPLHIKEQVFFKAGERVAVQLSSLFPNLSQSFEQRRRMAPSDNA